MATGSGEASGERYPLVHVGPAAPDADPAHPPVRTGADRAARNWALACHLSPFLAWAIGVPGLLAPLVIWLIKRREVPAVDHHGREAFNFQLTVVLVELGLTLFAVLTFGFGAVLAIPLAIVVAVGALVLMIVAAVRASEGRPYRYPFTWRPL